VQVYETKINAATVEECDLYVFTSPSNIKGFLLNNPLPSKPTISWGETTSKVLMQQGFEIFKELDISSIDNLIEILTILKNSDIKSCNLYLHPELLVKFILPPIIRVVMIYSEIVR